MMPPTSESLYCDARKPHMSQRGQVSRYCVKCSSMAWCRSADDQLETFLSPTTSRLWLIRTRTPASR
jgi:hypothetical protein